MNVENKRAELPAALGQRRPKLAFFRANARGTGCMMTMELHPAHDYTDGCIMMCMANQKTIGNRLGPNPTYATFDTDNTICVKLDFNDLCKFLQVFRGECESLEEGRGIYHQTSRATTKIVLRHVVEQTSGYSLEVYRTQREGGKDTHAHMLLDNAEALGISESIAGSLSLISFGIPMLIPHDTSAYKAENRERRNVTAA